MSALTVEARARLKTIAEAATPGPWSWFGNTKVRSIYLATVDRGRRYVLDFCRWGMSGAQPRFQDYSGQYGVLRDAKDLVVYEVEYRRDFHDIDNPDARFIAAADPSTVLALLAEIERLEAKNEELEGTLSRTCETPDDDCYCAGCLALEEHAANTRGSL